MGICTKKGLRGDGKTKQNDKLYANYTIQVEKINIKAWPWHKPKGKALGKGNALKLLDHFQGT